MGAIYFPILRGKFGEIDATAGLSSRARSRTQPMFDLPKPIPGEKIEDLVSGIVQGLSETWGTSEALAIDLSRYGPEIVTATGVSAVEYAFGIARQYRLKAVPVSGPIAYRGPGTNYLDAVRRIAHQQNSGAIIRIPHDELCAVDTLVDVVDQCRQALGLDFEQIDLYLDSGALGTIPIKHRNTESLAAVWLAAFSAVSHRPFRNVVFCGSSIPKTFKKPTGRAPYRKPRVELLAFRELLGKIDAEIGFGDYGARDPIQVDPTGETVTVPSRVNLATDRDCLFYRASRVEHRLTCQEAVRASEFASQIDCVGKWQIRECALYGRDIGGPRTWVARDTNLHVENTIHILENERGRRDRPTEVTTTDVRSMPSMQLSIEDA